MQWPVVELAEWEELRQCSGCRRLWLAVADHVAFADRDRVAGQADDALEGDFLVLGRPRERRGAGAPADHHLAARSPFRAGGEVEDDHFADLRVCAGGVVVDLRFGLVRRFHRGRFDFQGDAAVRAGGSILCVESIFLV